MHFFKNILLFYNKEFSRIKTEVIELVLKNQATLKVVEIFDHLDHTFNMLPASRFKDDLKEVIMDERRLEIMSHFEEYPDMKGRLSIVFRSGNPVVETIKEVINSKHDLLIKTASGNKTFKDHLFGTIAVKLLRKCPCPVLIVKPSEKVSFKNILIPIDPESKQEVLEKNGPTDDQVCNIIMENSLALAKLGESMIDILHCWHLPGESLLSSARFNIEEEELQRIIQLTQKIAHHKIQSFVSDYDLSDINHAVILRKGDPGDIIADYAEKHETDLIVMGTIGRSGLSGLLIGSTAEKIIDRVNCSVLAVKPSNFITPIKI